MSVSWVGFSASARRSRAWLRPPRLIESEKAVLGTPRTFPNETPKPLLREAASARAVGLTVTLAAPTASLVCKGCRPRTARWQLSHWPRAILKRRITVLTLGISSWYWSTVFLKVKGPLQCGQPGGSDTEYVSLT